MPCVEDGGTITLYGTDGFNSSRAFICQKMCIRDRYGTDSGQIYGGFYDGANLSVRADADEYKGRTQLTAYGGGQSVRHIFDSDDNVEAVVAYTGT